MLNNQNGTWGGNLNIGTGQNLNLKIDFQYERFASTMTTDGSTFNLISIQVFDITNGLVSDEIFGSGDIEISYNGTNDEIFAAGYGDPGGSLFLGVSGEFGNLGDELPHGTTFDALVNNAKGKSLIARAPDSLFDNVAGLNGLDLSSGMHSFSSTPATVPLPSALPLMLIGLAGVFGKREKETSTIARRSLETPVLLSKNNVSSDL